MISTLQVLASFGEAIGALGGLAGFAALFFYLKAKLKTQDTRDDSSSELDLLKRNQAVLSDALQKLSISGNAASGQAGLSAADRILMNAMQSRLETVEKTGSAMREEIEKRVRDAFSSETRRADDEQKIRDVEARLRSIEKEQLLKDRTAEEAASLSTEIGELRRRLNEIADLKTGQEDISVRIASLERQTKNLAVLRGQLEAIERQFVELAEALARSGESGERSVGETVTNNALSEVQQRLHLIENISNKLQAAFDPMKTRLDVIEDRIERSRDEVKESFGVVAVDIESIKNKSDSTDIREHVARIGEEMVQIKDHRNILTNLGVRLDDLERELWPRLSTVEIDKAQAGDLAGVQQQINLAREQVQGFMRQMQEIHAVRSIADGLIDQLREVQQQMTANANARERLQAALEEIKGRVVRLEAMPRGEPGVKEELAKLKQMVLSNFDLLEKEPIFRDDFSKLEACLMALEEREAKVEQSARKFEAISSRLSNIESQPSTEPIMAALSALEQRLTRIEQNFGAVSRLQSEINLLKEQLQSVKSMSPMSRMRTEPAPLAQAPSAAPVYETHKPEPAQRAEPQAKPASSETWRPATAIRSKFEDMERKILEKFREG